MTCKPTLQRWAIALGADIPANANAKQLEQAIEGAIAPPPAVTLRQGIQNNWAVIRAEAIPAVRAVAANLRS